MKPRIRKFLAGLLSFGLLLQAASPLSALADGGSGTAPGLTVTVNGTDTYTLTVDENGQFTVPDTWTANANQGTVKLPTVTYSADTGFVFSGYFMANSLSITGNGSENITLDGGSFCAAMAPSAQDMSELAISSVHNVTMKSNTQYPLVRGNVNITASGDVDIQNIYSGYTYHNACISKSLTVDTTGSLTMNCTTGPAVAETLTVRNASFVDLSASTKYGVIGGENGNGSAVFNNCGSVMMTNSYSWSGGCAIHNSSSDSPLTVTAPAGMTPVYYKLYGGSYTVTDISACKTSKYFGIVSTSDSGQCNITVNGLAVTTGNMGNIGGLGITFTPDDATNPGAGGTLTTTKDFDGNMTIVVSGDAENKVDLVVNSAIKGISRTENSLDVTGAANVTINGRISESTSGLTDIVKLTKCSGTLTYHKSTEEDRLYSVMNGSTYVTPADQPETYTLEMDSANTVVIGLGRQQYVNVNGGSAYMDAACKQALPSKVAIGTTVYLKPDAAGTNQKFYQWKLSTGSLSQTVTAVDAASGIYSFVVDRGSGSTTYTATAVYSYGFSVHTDRSSNSSAVEVTTENHTTLLDEPGFNYDADSNKLAGGTISNASLTITVDKTVNPTLDVELDAITDVVEGANKVLTVTGARNVAVKNLGCAADLDITGNVTFGNTTESYSAVRGPINIKNAKDVTLLHNGVRYSSTLGTISCSGDVNLTSNYGFAGENYASYSITTNGDVNITGAASGTLLSGTAYINCNALTIDGTATASPKDNVVGTLIYNGNATVLRGGATSRDRDYLASAESGSITLTGSSSSDGTYLRYITTSSENPHTVTLGTDVSFASGDRGAADRYEHERVTVTAASSDISKKLERFVFTWQDGTALTDSEVRAMFPAYSDDGYTVFFYMPAGPMTVSAEYTPLSKRIVTLPAAGGVTLEDDTSNGGFYPGQPVTIKAAETDPADDSKVFEKFVFAKASDPETELTGEDLAALDPKPDPSDKTKVTILMPDYDLIIKAVYVPLESYGFTVNGVDANATTLPTGLSYANGTLTAAKDFNRDLAIVVTSPTLKLDVDLKSVTGALTLTKVNNVTVNGEVSGVLTVGSETEAVSGGVTVKGKLGAQANINCAGDVLLENDFSYTTSGLLVWGARDVTVRANCADASAISGGVTITCTGTVDLENTSPTGVRAIGSNCTLTYTPARGGSYTVTLDGVTEPASSASPYKFQNTEDHEVKHILIIPANSGGNADSGTSGGGSRADIGSAGGAVAAIAIGGAAVWGGYQVATRVVLHNLLPAGADIPTTRGQLALLVWQQAGKPEPASTPAFADVADPDTAKAAQWCTEQGLLDAKTETTFKPDGLVTKVKVIEVWNKAFPKN